MVLDNANFIAMVMFLITLPMFVSYKHVKSFLVVD
jgi:hypothetical protein